MVDRHRNSFSQIEGPHGYKRWNIISNNEQTLIDQLNKDSEGLTTSLKLAPVNSSHIYARRHSAHACTATEDPHFDAQVQKALPPPLPLRPPPVPKRSFIPPPTPPTPPIPQHSPPLNPNVRKKSPLPPPLPPTPKSRAPPFNQLLPNQKPGLQDVKELAKELSRRPEINRNLPKEQSVTSPTNFPFDNVKDVKKTNITTVNKQDGKPPTPSRICKPNPGKISMRQDSGISSDSMSQNSSPSYTSKGMETPLLPPKNPFVKIQNGSVMTKPLIKDFTKMSSLKADELNGITKSVSTPAGLQTVVRFHNGSNMSVHHKILKESRRPSESYRNHRFFFKFRFIQLTINAIALFAIASGMTIYFKAYPSNVKIVNKTINVTALPIIIEKKSDNPAPGVCLPVIVKFCIDHNLPYNYTVYPNYVGHFGQLDAQQDLEMYDAVADVRCYELAALFLCTIFVPKCGPEGKLVRPCRGMCLETKRRCGFFLDVFGLTLPKYLECDLFPESPDPNVCIGQAEVKAVKSRESKPICPNGFQCDFRRCIPKDWQCDGHIDCKDQSDELNCTKCGTGMVHCGYDKCINQEHMCDGKVDCPWGQDERNCLRLSERNGDEGRGILEVFRPDQEQWVPACISQWDKHQSSYMCFLLGYAHTNYSQIVKRVDSKSAEHVGESRYSQKRHFNMIRAFASCNGTTYPTVNLRCTEYICGKARKSYAERKRTPRIVGGVPSKPGDWPFLAALLGGPEEVFYCAGVLIADQWVLTASHCVGNHSDINGWTIQLGITRRHAHSFYGQKMKVKRVVPHPQYNMGHTHDNDVALFQLASRVTFHEHLLPVCLPSPNRELEPGTTCTVIGWGKKDEMGSSEYEPEINEVEVPIVDRDVCNMWLTQRGMNVTDGMICAGYKEGGKDACQGDSGGPLLCRQHDDPERWFVGGIVSWGIKCAHPHLPGVYAYVPKYIPWIEEQIKLHSKENNTINWNK